jgi:hypothetical protein
MRDPLIPNQAVKNYVIALLITGMVVLGSFVYKYSSAPILRDFPIQKFKKENETARLYLIFCFSARNCFPCLEIIETLNRLPVEYKVIGLVPEEELKDEEELRKITFARFELRSLGKFKKFQPNYAPTLIGTGKRGEIFFILPGVPGENNYLEIFLESFMHKASSLL